MSRRRGGATDDDDPPCGRRQDLRETCRCNDMSISEGAPVGIMCCVAGCSCGMVRMPCSVSTGECGFAGSGEVRCLDVASIRDRQMILYVRRKNDQRGHSCFAVPKRLRFPCAHLFASVIHHSATATARCDDNLQDSPSRQLIEPHILHPSHFSAPHIDIICPVPANLLHFHKLDVAEPLRVRLLQ